jgi:hypothetical protein
LLNPVCVGFCLLLMTPRYPKVPVLKPSQAAATDAEKGTSAAAPASDLAAIGNVIVGFDLMSINLADLAWAPKLLPVS